MSYQFKSVGKKCAVTGFPLEPGTTCHSAIVERDGKITRLDFSSEGWNEAPADIIGHWQTQIPDAPPDDQKRPLDPNELMALFEQLGESPNPVQERLRYALALLLMRKRRLTMEGQRSDGEIEYLLVSGAHGEGMFEVREHELDDEEMQRLQADLEQHMMHNDNPDE